MARYTSCLYVGLCFLVLSHVCSAQLEQQQRTWLSPDPRTRLLAKTDCQIERLTAQEPSRQLKSEAGVTEFWYPNSDEFLCAGVEAVRHVIETKGLLLTSYSNTPQLTYIVQGRGILGTVFPGCPETYESELQSSWSGDQRQGSTIDRHQKLRRFREGDVIALPPGVAHWIYNDGNASIISVSLLDSSSNSNFLDQNYWRFFLAGNPQQSGGQHEQKGHGHSQEWQEHEPSSIFKGFDEQILADVYKVDTETVRNLQSPNDQRGSIVKAERFQVVIPEYDDQEEQEQKQHGRGGPNGLEETICTMRLVQNIASPQHADVYNPRGGRISLLDGQNFPILNYLQLGAVRGVLYKNAILVPFWNVNAHSVIYIIKGSGRIQVVGSRGKSVFDDQVREGQIIIVPQNFAVVKKAGNEGLEWVAFKTSENAMISTMAGSRSALGTMPEDVLMNSYRISREEARSLKFNREESTLFGPRDRSQGVYV